MDDADVPLMVENFASFVPMDSGNVLRFKLVIYILTNMKEIVIDRIKCFKEANKKYPRCTVEQFDKFINEYEVPSTEVVTELVNACRGIYHIETELALIDEFATNYTAEKALWWYTRESPFFRLLNGALRKQDIRMLYLLRFFIRDIYRQLLQNKKPLVMNVPCVYRGQSVSTDELNSIKSSFGYCLMMNSFISASTDRRTAVSYAISSKIREGRHPVLLEIQVATDSGEAVPYADIHDISDVPVENEILFMCGGVFKINDLNYDKNEKLWILKLDLCGESEMKYNDAYQLLKQDIGDYITIIDLGNAVINLGKFDIAEDLYLQGLKKTSRSDEENISRCYERLGSVSFLKGDVDKAVDLIKYSIELMSNSRKFTQENNYLYIYFNYYSLGVAYMEKKDYVLARKNFEAALEYQMRMNELHPSLLLDVYVKIASTYCYEKNYHSAQISLTQAFGIMNDNMLQAHPLSAAALELLGDIHVGNEEYRKALKLYQESIELQCLTQTKSCMSTGSIMKKISDVCKELAKERLSQQDPDKEFKIADEHTDDLINPAMILFNIVKKLVP
jgi:tetratricopeptide (TPR) repeat protein